MNHGICMSLCIILLLRWNSFGQFWVLLEKKNRKRSLCCMSVCARVITSNLKLIWMGTCLKFCTCHSLVHALKFWFIGIKWMFFFCKVWSLYQAGPYLEWTARKFLRTGQRQRCWDSAGGLHGPNLFVCQAWHNWLSHAALYQVRYVGCSKSSVSLSEPIF